MFKIHHLHYLLSKLLVFESACNLILKGQCCVLIFFLWPRVHFKLPKTDESKQSKRDKIMVKYV